MADPTGESNREALKLNFDRRLLLQFRGSTITSDAGLLAYRELDDALHLTDTAADRLADARTGKNGRHRLAGLLRQALFGRLAGYEDVNDAERLRRDPAMCWVVGDRAVGGSAAEIQPNGVAIDLGREAITGIAGANWRGHPVRLPALLLIRKPASSQVDNAATAETADLRRRLDPEAEERHWPDARGGQGVVDETTLSAYRPPICACCWCGSGMAGAK